MEVPKQTTQRQQTTIFGGEPEGGEDQTATYGLPAQLWLFLPVPLVVTHLIFRGSENKTDVLVPDILLKDSPFPSPLLLTID